MPLTNAPNRRVVLAYSGGLDTSVILVWLVEQGYEVFAYLADVGQREDLWAAADKARALGAAGVCVEDLREEFVSGYIYPVISANTVYEGRYLLGTAVARPLIAKQQVAFARRVAAAFLAHGATGKGNDQVRFELAYHALAPDLGVIAPWKDPHFLAAFQGRSDMIRYARAKGIEIKSSLAKPYSEDENLLHISHEAGILERPDHVAPEDVYTRTVAPEDAPDEPAIVRIDFREGIPVAVHDVATGEGTTGALDIFLYLDRLGSTHGIGRLDMVENRFVGVKSRGIYETPAGTILLAAHRDLEGVAMDREVMRLRDLLTPRLSELVYNGFWFSPEMEFLLAAVQRSQEGVDGHVLVKLYKGSAFPIARSSPNSLYDPEISSMDAAGGFDQTHAEGFIRIHAVRLKAHHAARARRAAREEAATSNARATHSRLGSGASESADAALEATPAVTP
jgi:argininosuccinate synthase